MFADDLYPNGYNFYTFPHGESLCTMESNTKKSTTLFVSENGKLVNSLNEQVISFVITNTIFGFLDIRFLYKKKKA